ncbi:thioredoxin family protein [Nonlabens xiamenensis]|uniref:thioredoxin family protein n=1 Tax=Nonlabens xiamenensis TaxID=2341043 RepID=UPI000F606CF2|nr:thioredoxin family protein [Nonlabens xiamenensis]
MKKILIIISMALLASCASQQSASKSTDASTPMTTSPEPAQTPTTPITVNKDASGNLSGRANKAAFMQAPFDAWFEVGYNNYTPDSETLEELKPALEDVEIRAYMGTWCGDSKRETPRFYKILDAADYDYDKLTMITVDRSKTRPEELVDGYDLNRVPTFIFYRDGKELGRYVEYARESLEKDVLKIVTGGDYKHSYQQ